MLSIYYVSGTVLRICHFVGNEKNKIVASTEFPIQQQAGWSAVNFTNKKACLLRELIWQGTWSRLDGGKTPQEGALGLSLEHWMGVSLGQRTERGEHRVGRWLHQEAHAQKPAGRGKEHSILEALLPDGWSLRCEGSSGTNFIWVI